MNEPETTTEAEVISGDQLMNQPAAAGAGGAGQPPRPTTTATPSPEFDKFSGQKDSLGREWNPVKFRLKDGVPQKDSLGRFVASGFGQGRKSKLPDESQPASGSRIPGDDTGPSPAQQEITAELGVEVAIGIVQTALIMVGEEEGVLDDMEKQMLRGPLLRILEKYNLKSKMTPELESMAVLATLIMRRLKKPKTMGWFQRQMERVRNWWISRRLGKIVPDPITEINARRG